MKRIRLLWLAGILITSGGCDSTTAPDGEGRLLGRLEGEIWRGSALMDFSDDTLTIHSARSADQGLEHVLHLRVVETAPGAFAVVTQAPPGRRSEYQEILGGDGIVYSAVVTAGTIRFTELDRRRGRASGTLSLTLTGTRGTWRFADGHFEARSWRDPYER
ncbi:MAG TPA: hypothetical protein VHG08_14740 [Longimicrobium sp.]|nr:hypothetical protein [Longimicrobium sp.]